MYRCFVLPLVFISFACFTPAANAQVSLSFDQSGIFDSIPIDQAYGDRVVSSPDVNNHAYDIVGLATTPNVEVSYSALDPRLWTTGYGNLTNVYFDETDFSNAFSLTLDADSGFEVDLLGFDVAAFGGIDISVPEIEIRDGDSNVLFSQSSALISGSTHTSFDFLDGISANSLTIEIDLTGLGGASDNIGIDNVSFVQEAVPEPSSLLILGVAVAGIACKRRRYVAV